MNKKLRKLLHKNAKKNETQLSLIVFVTIFSAEIDTSQRKVAINMVIKYKTIQNDTKCV